MKLTTLTTIAALLASPAYAIEKPDPKPEPEPPTVTEPEPTPKQPDPNSPPIQHKVCDLDDPSRKAWWDNRYCPRPSIIVDHDAPLTKL